MKSENVILLFILLIGIALLVGFYYKGEIDEALDEYDRFNSIDEDIRYQSYQAKSDKIKGIPNLPTLSRIYF